MRKRGRTGGEDEDLGRVGYVPPLVQDGTYSAGFLRAEQGRYEGRDRWFLWFRIVTAGTYFGYELYLSCPFPTTGKTFGFGSKLVRALLVATGHMPRRRDRISAKMFYGKAFIIKTRTVKKDRNGRARPADQWYSVIDELLQKEAGA